MKYSLTGLLFFILSASCYADECSDPNPYVQQTCQNLKQSATKVQAARDEEDKKIMQQRTEALRKVREGENKPAPPPPPKIPDWQKALKPASPMQKHDDTTATQTNETTARSEAPATAPLPAGPTEFSGSKAVTLPGGVSVVPIKPNKDSKDGKEGAIKYY